MTCAVCDDTGWKPTAEHAVTRCDCWKARVYATLLRQANIPQRYEHCTLENFRAYNAQLTTAVEKAQAVFDISHRRGTRGLVFEGQAGTGKTHLAVALLRAILRQHGQRGLFYATSDLLRVIRHTYQAGAQTSEADVLQPVMTADVLVLDDLGTEKTTEWVDETMNLIINTRYSERRLMIVTTNYFDTPDTGESLLARIGERMTSRLHEMCDFVSLSGADYRNAPRDADEHDLRVLSSQRRQLQAPSVMRRERMGSR